MTPGALALAGVCAIGAMAAVFLWAIDAPTAAATCAALALATLAGAVALAVI